MILGTAGHVDHGKTALVRALTGIDTDRLPEEKRRGITLELGFAHLPLPNGDTLGLVDVPGHERFVKSMLAGAGGIDLALLVVALDEGVMPQTREHLDICALLGVRHGCIALTKSDLLPTLGEDWESLVREELQALTRGTFLEGAAAVSVSSKTGHGLDALRAELERLASLRHPRPSDGPLFLPLDRAFTLNGFGTVVTGTLLSGELGLTDEVALLPSRSGAAPLRIRGLQSHGVKQARVHPGARVAVNLADVDAKAIPRGTALTRFAELPESRALDVELTLLAASPRPLHSGAELLLHLGTDQVACRVRLLEGKRLEPGATALAQLLPSRPLAALTGQRFVLRGTQPLSGRGATLAGGRVLQIAVPRGKRDLEKLTPLADTSLDLRVAALVEAAGRRGIDEAELSARGAFSRKLLGPALQRLGARGRVLALDSRSRYVATPAVEALGRRVLARLEATPEGLSRETLRRGLGATPPDRPLLDRVLARLSTEEKLTLDGDHLALPNAKKTPAPERDADLLRTLEQAGLAPPTLAQLAEGQHTTTLAASLKSLVAARAVVKVSEDLYFSTMAVERLRQRLVEKLGRDGEISTQGFKDLVQQSRKYVIPLSEYFDRERVTLRVGDKRVLRRG